MIRWSPSAPRRPSCPHRRLVRLLAIELGQAAAIGESSLRAWASANFVGARHRFSCEGREMADALRERLMAVEWRLPGHIVADIAVERDADGAFTVEILTVEE